MSIKSYLSSQATRIAKSRLLTKINCCLAGLYLLRVLLCLLPQHGYLHPDEFFQFTEPMAVKAGIRGQLTWEWNEKQPIRSAVLPFLLGRSVIQLIKTLTGPNIICTYLMLVLPRLVFTLISFSLDYLLWQCCTIAKITKFKEVLVVFATSYLTLVHLGHTLTNSIETWLFAVLLFILFKSIKTKKESNLKKLAFVLTLGVWNRPTFILFSLYPVGYWATLENHSSRKVLANLKLVAARLIKLLSVVKLFSFLFILADTLFYHGDYVFSTISSGNYVNFDFRRLVVTPWNFIQFNAKPENLQIFGVNPLYLHLVLNLQLLFCFLGVLLLKDLVGYTRKLLADRKKERQLFFKTNFQTVLALCIAPPVAILSLVPHQEPRFLLPLLFPLVLAYGSRVYNSRALFWTWIVFNVLLTGFYGYVHQAGVTRSMFVIKPRLSQAAVSNVNIIYSSTYLPPQHLLGIHGENQSKYRAKINFYDLSVAKFPEELLKTLNTIKSASKSASHQTYLIAPSTLSGKLSQLERTLSIKLNLFTQLFPTFDFESFELPRALSLGELKSKFSTNIYVLN